MPPRYEEISIYDIPQVLAAQALQGRVGVRNTRDLLLNREGLAPRDRLQVSDLIAQKTGMGKVGEGVLDVATNPFIWLMVLTHNPAGKSSIQKYGTLQAVKKGASAYQKQYRGWVHNWIMGVNEATAGTELPTVFQGIAARMRGMGQYAHREMARSERAVVDHINQLIFQETGNRGRLKALEYKGLKRSSAEYKELRRFEKTLGAMSSQEHRLYKQRVLAGEERFYEVDQTTGKLVELFADHEPGVKRGLFQELLRKAHQEAEAGGPVRKFREGTVEVTRDTVERPARMNANVLEAGWQRYGPAGEEFLRTAADTRRWAMWKALGKETNLRTFEQDGEFKISVRNEDGEVIPFEFDENKLYRFAKRLRGEAAREGDALALEQMESRDILESIVGGSAVEDLRHRIDPLLKREAWDQHTSKQLADAMMPENWADDLWMPRDTVDVVPFIGPDGRRVVPRMDLSQVQREAKGSSSIHNIKGAVIGRVIGRRHADLPLHPDDMRILEEAMPGLLTKEGRAHMDEVTGKARAAHEKGEGVAVQAYRLDYVGAHRTGLDQMIQLAATNSAIDNSVINAERVHSRHWKDKHDRVTRPGATTKGPGDIEDSVYTTHADEIQKRAVTGGEAEALKYTESFSLWDQVERATARMDAPWQDFIRTTALPTAIHRGRTPALMTYANSQLAKARAQHFAYSSPIGRLIRGSSTAGRRFMEHFEDIANTPGIVSSPDFSKGVARYLYVTHLGANLSSVMLNLTQPLLLAAATGDVPLVLRAYGLAFRDMAGYARDRVKYGPGSLIKGISETDKMRLIHDNMPLTRYDVAGEARNLVGIEPDFYRVVDEYAADRTRKGFVARAEDILMGMFEKSEWLNRNVAGYMAEGMHAKWGAHAGNAFTRTSPEQLADDVEWLTNFTQFGANPLNRPLGLQKGVLSNPVTKVFLTFPWRMATGALHTFPSMEGSSLPHFWARAMGWSAAIHELSKNFLNVDMSRGLFFDASTDIFAMERMVSGEDPISSRLAAVNIPVGIVRGIAKDDQAMLANTFARLLPAGVAASRVYSVLPEARGHTPDAVADLQRSYVDWGDGIVGEDGRTLYPTFTPEGRLVEYRSGPEIVMKGLGVDLGAWGEQGSLDHYLVQQSEEMKRMKHEALRRLRAGDVSGAMRIRDEFEDRFSDPKTGARVPFTISQSQLNSFMKTRDVGRTERILDGMPSEARQTYQNLVASSGYARNVRREALISERTARARTRGRLGDEDTARRLRDLEAQLALLQGAAGGPVFGR